MTLERLAKLVSFPTVSAESRRSADMRACAGWLASLLRRTGLGNVRVRDAASRPPSRRSGAGGRAARLC